MSRTCTKVTDYDFVALFACFCHVDSVAIQNQSISNGEIDWSHLKHSLIPTNKNSYCDLFKLALSHLGCESVYSKNRKAIEGRDIEAPFILTPSHQITPAIFLFKLFNVHNYTMIT